MSVNSKMTALADEIRELSGTTDPIGLDAMTTHVNQANEEINTQVNLLAQAVSALQGKSAGSSANNFPYTITVIQSGVDGAEAVICYGDDGDTAVIFTNWNSGGVWNSNEIISGCSLINTILDSSVGTVYLLKNFTDNAVIQIEWTLSESA